MPENYEVILYDLGTRKDRILGYLRNNHSMGYKEALQLVDRLPVVIRTTNNKFEANIIKEAMEAFGAKVKVRELTDPTDSADESSVSGGEWYDSATSETGSISRSFEGTNSAELYTNYDSSPESADPIKGPATVGCASVIVIGFLIIISGIVVLNTLL